MIDYAHSCVVCDIGFDENGFPCPHCSADGDTDPLFCSASCKQKGLVKHILSADCYQNVGSQKTTTTTTTTASSSPVIPAKTPRSVVPKLFNNIVKDIPIMQVLHAMCDGKCASGLALTVVQNTQQLCTILNSVDDRLSSICKVTTFATFASLRSLFSKEVVETLQQHHQSQADKTLYCLYVKGTKQIHYRHLK